MDETPTDTTHRSEPPQQGDETATLLGFLEYLRATVAWKTEGLSTAQLHERPLSSTMTLGGMLRHLTYVEDHWFCYVLSGQRQCSPWDAVEWEKDPDWDWDSASVAGGDALRTHWAATVEQSRQRWENLRRGARSPDGRARGPSPPRGHERPVGAHAHGRGVRAPLRPRRPAAGGDRWRRRGARSLRPTAPGPNHEPGPRHSVSEWRSHGSVTSRAGHRHSTRQPQLTGSCGIGSRLRTASR